MHPKVKEKIVKATNKKYVCKKICKIDIFEHSPYLNERLSEIKRQKTKNVPCWWQKKYCFYAENAL
jgi:hypothetical protein